MDEQDLGETGDLGRCRIGRQVRLGFGELDGRRPGRRLRDGAEMGREDLDGWNRLHRAQLVQGVIQRRVVVHGDDQVAVGLLQEPARRVKMELTQRGFGCGGEVGDEMPGSWLQDVDQPIRGDGRIENDQGIALGEYVREHTQRHHPPSGISWTAQHENSLGAKTTEQYAVVSRLGEPPGEFSAVAGRHWPADQWTRQLGQGVDLHDLVARHDIAADARLTEHVRAACQQMRCTRTELSGGFVGCHKLVVGGCRADVSFLCLGCHAGPPCTVLFPPTASPWTVTAPLKKFPEAGGEGCAGG
ncbi:hypothetical protein F1D05_02655 [Kribbella qitaiheensis]|uniref:Uncharacterized protein n=1 Tax=Kribbella qitaiheensis TaxID=1544730 RepID=A0A7G6WSP6_9ACTN|nr:hypothetical protein [Kribbella qitaiheensis]QNE17011.1 hypothetical protein F1D05_02655 [Kribbella qitaiheensis]